MVGETIVLQKCYSWNELSVFKNKIENMQKIGRMSNDIATHENFIKYFIFHKR